MTLHFLMGVIFVMLSRGLFADETVEHPFIEPKGIKPETCLACHPEKKAGKFVHRALGRGCQDCHQVVSENGRTSITPVAVGGALCAKCHEARKDSVLHGPYKNGQCIICHDPHSTEFEAQTRAEGNSLCLACHAPKQVAGNLLVPKMPRADLDAIPKIELDPTLRFGHPWAVHPVAGLADPLRPGEKMSCLSCHDPHGAAQEKLIVSARGGRDICDACHRALDAERESGRPQPKERPQSQVSSEIPAQSGGKVKP